MMESECRDAGCDEENDEVFMQGIAFPQENVQEHDGEEFAGFGEGEGDVIDVSEGGVAKGGGERGGQGDEEERGEDFRGGEDGERGGRGSGCEEVDVA